MFLFSNKHTISWFLQCNTVLLECEGGCDTVFGDKGSVCSQLPNLPMCPPPSLGEDSVVAKAIRGWVYNRPFAMIWQVSHMSFVCNIDNELFIAQKFIWAVMQLMVDKRMGILVLVLSCEYLTVWFDTWNYLLQCFILRNNCIIGDSYRAFIVSRTS